MYTKIGEKLEEARKRKGVSIKEAAQATKVRTDFLLNFESNDFDFDLHTVYKEGFLKLYARYLKLDPKEIVEEFRASTVSGLHSVRRTETESLGRMELPTQQVVEEEATAYNTKERDLFYEEDRFYETDDEPSSAPTVNWKTGAIFGGTFAFVALVAVGIGKFITSEPATVNTQIASTEMVQAPTQETLQSTLAQPFREELFLMAEDTVHVVVLQEKDKKRLFSGNMRKGDTHIVEHEGAVKIHFSDGDKLVLEREDGKRVKPGRSGVGWIRLG
mgnify:CR=1 FL=1|tara:strand:- start:19351 stop:20172 length:822 start_codon:yes stop_codon:yes gene_type:complete